jgi:hypothetical protein
LEKQHLNEDLLIIILATLISIPLGLKAGNIANHHAFPLICGINLMTLMDFVL